MHRQDDDRTLVPLAQVDASGPTWDRLEDQLGWYEGKSTGAQRAYKRLKVRECWSLLQCP